MGINITEIGQKVLDVTANAANIFRKMYDLHFNPNPLDVPFEYIDENGNKVTTTIKNVAGFRKRVWDDVGGALGQFNRTFYVDAENGDDNNDGSENNPFKTIKKAIDSVPVGGYGFIKLIKVAKYLIEEDIEILNKTILIFGEFDTDLGFSTLVFKRTSRDDNTDRFFEFDCINSFLFFSGCSFDFTDSNQNNGDINTLNPPLALTNSHLILTNGDPWSDDHKVKITAGDNRLCFLKNRYQYGVSSATFLYCEFDFDYDNKTQYIASLDITGKVFTLSLYGCNFINSPITDLVTGIVKDADSGNPINLLSNINFSD